MKEGVFLGSEIFLSSSSSCSRLANSATCCFSGSAAAVSPARISGPISLLRPFSLSAQPIRLGLQLTASINHRDQGVKL